MATTETTAPRSPAGSAGPASVIVITPPRGWQVLNLRELWAARELLLFLTWRDVAVRYKQTLLGAAWAVLQPAMMMVVFTIFLGRLAHVDSGDLPYPVFVYAGLLPWTFFATAIANAGNSVVASAQMVSKIYFPRLLIPLACVAAAVVDFLIAFLLLAGLMFHYGIVPGWQLVLLPLVLAVAAIAATGVGVLLAALNVAYRDFKYTIPFLVQVWMFATPTVYMNIDAISQPAAAATAETAPVAVAARQAPAADSATAPGPEGLTAGVKLLLGLNPMTGLIAFFRAATLGGVLPWARLGQSALISLGLFLAGMTYFRRVESRFADII
jgi:lipopolysaccharide transport system permease protein